MIKSKMLKRDDEANEDVRARRITAWSKKKRERKRERKKRDSSHCAVTKTYLARGLKGGEPSRDCGTLSYTT